MQIFAYERLQMPLRYMQENIQYTNSCKIRDICCNLSYRWYP